MESPILLDSSPLKPESLIGVAISTFLDVVSPWCFLGPRFKISFPLSYFVVANLKIEAEIATDAVFAVGRILAQSIEASGKFLAEVSPGRAAAAAANRELLRSLEIPFREVRAQPSRLGEYVRDVEKIPERNSVAGPFETFNDFCSRGLEQISTPVRKYPIIGRNTSVIIPEDFAAALESGSIVGGEKLVTPQHIPSLVDLMPDSRYIHRINLFNKPNAEDAWVAQTYIKGFKSTMSMTDNQINMYSTERTYHLRRDVKHEWSHEMRYHHFDDDLMWKFADAVKLERSEWNLNGYAKRNNGEQWAVLGEPILGTGAAKFIETIGKAPIRSSVWNRGFQKTLDDVPLEYRSIDHSSYVARSKYIEDNAVPKAIEKIRRLNFNLEQAITRDGADELVKFLEKR